MTTTSKSMRRALYPAFMVLLLGFLAFAFQGSRGLWEPDEGRYVSIAKEMLETGDFLIPRLNGEIYIDKPPLSIWGIAAGMRILGPNERGARAFHALCFAATAYLVCLLGSSLAGKRQGVVAGIVYATMGVPFFAGNIITPDTPLTLWTTAAFLCLWESVKPGARRVALYKLLMCVSFGLGFLTKGPAALVPSAGMVVFLLLKRRLWGHCVGPWMPFGVLLFCILGLNWYVFVAHRVPGSLEYFWDNQIWGRTVSPKYNRHPGLSGALVTYPPILLLGALPWSGMWLGWLSRNHSEILSRAWWRGILDDSSRTFLATWIAVPLAVFFAASSKLPLYVLPVFPALALVTARIWPSFPAASAQHGPCGISTRVVASLAIWLAVLPISKLVVAHVPTYKDMRALHAAMANHLPDQPYEVVSVSDSLNGLSLYGVTRVKDVRTSDRSYPVFAIPEHINEEVQKMVGPDSNLIHLLVCRRESRADKVRAILADSTLEVTEIALPFDRRMFMCLDETRLD